MTVKYYIYINIYIGRFVYEFQILCLIFIYIFLITIYTWDIAIFYFTIYIYIYIINFLGIVTLFIYFSYNTIVLVVKVVYLLQIHL